MLYVYVYTILMIKDEYIMYIAHVIIDYTGICLIIHKKLVIKFCNCNL